MGPLTRRGDLGVLSAEFDVPTAFMTARNPRGPVAHRVDVIAYETSCSIGSGLEVDEDSSGAFVVAVNAGGIVFHRVDVDARRSDRDAIGGVGSLRTFDSLTHSGRFAAHGGLLGQSVSRAESQHGEQGHGRDRNPCM